MSSPAKLIRISEGSLYVVSIRRTTGKYLPGKNSVLIRKISAFSCRYREKSRGISAIISGDEIVQGWGHVNPSGGTYREVNTAQHKGASTCCRNVKCGNHGVPGQSRILTHHTAILNAVATFRQGPGHAVIPYCPGSYRTLTTRLTVLAYPTLNPEAEPLLNRSNHLALLLCYSGVSKNLQTEQPGPEPVHQQLRGTTEASAGER